MYTMVTVKLICLHKGPFKCYVTQWGWGYTDQLRLAKVHDPTLLALQGDGLVSNLKKKGNVY